MEFEMKSSDQLSNLLRKFYAEARTKQEKPYSRTALHSIRAALQRHISSPPFNRIISIISDAEFKPANIVFTGRLKLNRAQGTDKTKHKEAIQPGDLQKMYTSEVLSNRYPQALLYKVFFEISLHFVRRAKEGLRDLRKNSFEIKADDQGLRYATIGYNEKTKKDHGDKKEFVEKEQRMYEQPDDPACPLKSLELYLDKLHPNGQDFFQQPRSGANGEIWYNGRPIGASTLATFMSKISKEANLSHVYTNHCIRATAITILSTAGVDGTDIIGVSGHKSIQSLIPYQRKVGDEKRRNMSGLLAKYGKAENRIVPKVPSTNITSTDVGAISTSDQVCVTETQNQPVPFCQNQLQGLLQGNHFHAPVSFNIHVQK